MRKSPAILQGRLAPTRQIYFQIYRSEFNRAALSNVIRSVIEAFLRQIPTV